VIVARVRFAPHMVRWVHERQHYSFQYEETAPDNTGVIMTYRVDALQELMPWLLALGIDVRFTRKRCPTDHAKIERTHQTMTLQALLGQYWPDQTALWAGLDARRTMLNQHIPSRALHGQAPLQAYPEASHSGRSYRPEWEIEMLDVQRVFQYLANCRWFRRVKSNGRIAIGGYEYYLSTALRGRTLELTFDLAQGTFLGQPEDSDSIIAIAPQGLSKTELMGEFGNLLRLPVYQLALPFTHEAWRQLEYTRTFATPSW
jgi:hypothetical protein